MVRNGERVSPTVALTTRFCTRDAPSATLATNRIPNEFSGAFERFQGNASI